VKRTQAETLEVVRELLEARLVADGSMGIGGASARLGRIFAGIAVHVIQLFCFAIIGFQLIVGDRPGRRHAAVVFDFAKIFLAQAKQRRAEEFRVAAYIVIGVRVEFVAGCVMPFFFGLISSFEVYGTRIPIVFFPPHVAATL
jgi:hypothetical protein